MFEKFRINKATARLFEEKLFEIALIEFESEQKRPGLWSKAISGSDGDIDRAKSIYLKLRVQSLQDEILISTTMDKWLASKKHEDLSEIAKQQLNSNDKIDITCCKCDNSEALALKDITKTDRYRKFSARKTFLYNIVILKCNGCGQVKKIDYQGRQVK